MGRLTKILPFPAPKYAYTEGRQDRILLCSLFSLSVFPVSRDLSIIKKEKVKKSYSFFTRKPRQRHLLSLSLSLPPSLCNDIYLSILGRYRQLSLSHSLTLSLTYLCLFRKREKQRAKASLSRTCCCSQALSPEEDTEK
jgi:phenylacetate-coenzyme A ligase PaaK-like adenylate-forming protein